MTVFTSATILILVAIIISLLQLVPGTFSIFYHYALGKTTIKKADDQSLSFILGTEIFTGSVWILFLIILSTFGGVIDIYSMPFFLIISGIFFAEAIAFLLFYFRHGSHTALFIPRGIANGLRTLARKTKSRSDALALGFFVNLPEFIFTFPLYLISAIILLNVLALPRAIIIITYIISITLPLFCIRLLYHNGHNLAHITRLRASLKPYIRIIIPLAYIFLALTTINLGIINHG